MIVVEAAALGGVTWVTTQALFVLLKREYTELHAFVLMGLAAVAYLTVIQEFSVGVAALSLILAETWRITMVLLSNATVRMLVISQRRF